MARWGTAASAAMAVMVLGCGSDAMPSLDAGLDASPDGGPSCTTLLWDGPAGGLARWPEPALLVEDPTTETGRRVAFDAARFPELASRLAGYVGVFEIDLATVDGFGISAEAFFQFDRHFEPTIVPSGDATVAGTAGLGFVVIAPGEPRIIGALTQTTDDDRTLLLAPMMPLPAQGRVAVFVTRALTEAAGGCLEPSPAMRASIDAPDSDTAAAIEALIALGAIESADELVAITAFPTQSIEQDSLAVARDVEARSFDFEAAPVCTPEVEWVRCEAGFVAQDYRDPEDGIFRRARGEDAAPRATYVVPVTFWLPLTGTGPFPTMVFGHGLGGDRYQAQRLAQFAAPMGYATLAIDSLQHGDHPTTAGEERTLIATVLSFFALDSASERTFEAARMRDHFRQSTWDKLQLTQLLLQHPDVTGDGIADLDTSRLAYLGVSLGGIMGPELLATSDDYGVGVLVVPGGRVSSIISESEMFGAIVVGFRPRGTTEGDVRRFFPILQTVIERGDAASYGPHLVRDRLPGADAITPSVLAGIVLDDDTVPNVANYTLARAMGLEVVEPVLRPEPGLRSVLGPISGNVAGGATAGVLQFDVVGDGIGGVETATHSNVGDSDVGVAAWLDFLDTHFTTGLARIRDPYAAIGLAHPSP